MPRRWRFLALALGLVALAAAIGLGQSASSPFGASDEDPPPGTDHAIDVSVQAIPCPHGFDNQEDDDVCLAYDGQIPGPTWTFQEGDTVEVTLHHNVTESLAELDVDEALASSLSEARYSLHRHGIAVSPCDDGISQPEGTGVCDGTLGPPGTSLASGNITYAFTTSFPGSCHYHDHATGAEGNVVTGPVLGEEAKNRGLFGSFLVLEEGENTDHVFDLHFTDAGANGGLGLDETVAEGDRFDVLVTGLGDAAWTVTLTDPSGDLVRELELGPGVSRAITVLHAEPGGYAWTATSPVPYQQHAGTIEVMPS